MKIFTLYLLLLLFCGTALAQGLAAVKRNTESADGMTAVKAGKSSGIIPLKVGDRIPDVELEMINYPSDKARLSDFKGKIIVLDFWATYCSSCLAHFPIADSLLKVYHKDIQILLVNALVNKDSKEKIIKTLRRYDRPSGQSFAVPCAINDTLLNTLFPHFYIPHYIWIDKEGVIRAITSADELTAKNINRFLAKNGAPARQKLDVDPNVPMYTAKELPIHHLLQFSMLIKGENSGIGWGGVRRIGDTVRGIILHNRDLLSMYHTILYHKMQGLTDNRIVLEVKDSSGICYCNTRLSMKDWRWDNVYSYENVEPIGRTAQMYDDALEDLNRYTPYIAKMEKRKTLCWVLARDGVSDMLHSRGDERRDALEDKTNSRLLNGPMFSLVIFLNKISGNAVILDETGYTSKIDLEFKQGIQDMGTMQQALKPYGLKLYQAVKDIDMLVVRDK